MESANRKPLIILLLIAFFVILVRTAWIGDDSYITMRTIDNFINGHGLTWNVGERVQTYTHPLWMFLLIPLYMVSQNPYTSLISLSFVLSLLAMFLFLNIKDKDDLSIFIGWSALIFSNAFIDYSTSGLENPASHLILLIFILNYLKWGDQVSKKQVLILALLTSLIVLNRIDLSLLFLPAILEILATKDLKRRIGILFIGFLPIIIWECFSVIYYGFPFPNTYYAKLNTGISHAVLIRHGILYFFNSIAWDPITLIIIATSFTMSMISGNRKEKMISAGIMLYLGYILWIGGDFMSGRFLSVPLLASVVIMVSLLRNSTTTQKIFYLAIICFMGFMSFTPSFSAPTIRNDELENLTGVNDEQAWYYSGTGLLRWGRSSPLPNHQWIYEGRELRDQGVKVYVGKGIGFLGYSAGPNVHVIDYFALSDPLLSHLPVHRNTKILIGHYSRPIPAGYIATLETGNNQIENQNIKQYYEFLSLITKHQLWSAERWQAIWKINTGQYDYLLKP